MSFFYRKEDAPIDAVVLWVDGSDPKWLKEKEKHLKEFRKNNKDKYTAGASGTSKARFNDLDTLRYCLRSIEIYAPWINRVFLIVDNQVPKWLNKKCSNLVVKNHKDFFGKGVAYPTYNTNAIHMQLHNIPELSEQFILFDDDLLLFKKTKKEDFFRGGLPTKKYFFKYIPIR